MGPPAGSNSRFTVCPGPTFFLHGFEGVRRLQIVQDSLTTVLLHPVAVAEFPEALRRRLVTRMQDLLGAVDVSCEVVASIPKTPSGKYRKVISRVSPFARLSSARTIDPA
jgi:hypothetical protein